MPAAFRIFKCWLARSCGTPSASTSWCTQRRDSCKLQHHRDPHGRGERTQEFAGGLEDLPRRWRRQLGRSTVLVLADQFVVAAAVGMRGDILLPLSHA